MREPPSSAPRHALELSRVVRISVSALSDAARADNGTVGFAAPGLAALAEFEVVCRGQPAASGYLIDITAIDRAASEVLRPRLAAAIRAEAASGAPTDLGAFLRGAAAEIAARLPAPLVRLVFAPSRQRSVAVVATSRGVGDARFDGPGHQSDRSPYDGGSDRKGDPRRDDWNDPMTHAVILTESFEFAASHRLALPELDDAANRALFGKCSNPNGHGHNYRLDVEVEVAAGADGPPARGAGPRFGFAELAAVVAREIMGRFDHRHLNKDCPEFAALNPSVEHIAATCHRLLAPAIEAGGARLRSVRVWETEKTSCRYPA